MTGVVPRELHLIREFEDALRLFGGIWHSSPGGAPITVELMRALSHTGNYVAGAYDSDRLVGASIGFLATPAGQTLHSHVTGAVAGRGIGFALKLHQRAWAPDRGLERITWTYDPLVRRNAHFNLVKLGALPEEYLPSFYGAMDDAINTGDESDRMLAVWRLSEPQVVAAEALRRFLIPALPAHTDAHGAGRAMEPFKGHRMAKAALETDVRERGGPATTCDAAGLSFLLPVGAGGGRRARPTVRRPGGLAGVEVSRGDLRGLPRHHLHHGQVRGQTSQQARAVGLVLQAVGHDRGVRVEIAVRRAVRDPGAVGRPDRRVRAQRRGGEDVRLAAVHR
ncbi:putative GNAT superfamily acetyltransferase [Streptosporangium album]|uniref:Putative GNAT superfamily acetyltransferase n=1 Tax=Streptosporangium album TaxID=47479 RepID=A0A7W7S135_9ACTN|nr:hypothetical protein [Streptosporangium album]MBB4941974.1 putative GNAT superfamily acetyltransferase [Streptosporangium album]